MSNYYHYENMSKKDKDRMCDEGITQQNCELIRISTSSNGNKKSSLKRTESKMDENQQGSDDYPDVESDFEEVQRRVQGRPNQRGNKAPRTDSFVVGRTITSSVRSGGRTEKNPTRHISKQQEQQE